MATVEEVKKLASLARIRVPEAELEQFTKEFDAILAYVGQLEQLELPAQTAEGGSPDAGLAASRALRNVYREDADPTPAGQWTQMLTGAFPDSAEATPGKPEDGSYLVVKQIISHD